MATSTEAVLRKIFNELLPKDISYQMPRRQETIEWLPKKSNVVGDVQEGSWKIIAITAGSQGSNTFDDANSYQYESAPVAFSVPMRDKYVFVSISNRVLAGAKENAGAVVDAAAHVIKTAKMAFFEDLEFSLWSNSGGSRGQVGNISTTDLTLSRSEDSIRFTKGMRVQVSDTDGTSGALRDSGKFVTLTGVNRSTGVLTADANWSTITGTTADDHLFRKGDFGKGINGFTEWIPGTSSPGTLLGVNRNTDPSALAGVAMDASTSDILSAIIEMGYQMSLLSAYPDCIFANPMDVALIARGVQGKAEYLPKGKQDISSGHFSLLTPAGALEVKSARHCPRGKMYFLRKDTWALGSLLEVPHFDTQSGDKMLIEQSADAKRVRLKAYVNLGCLDTSQNGVLNLV